MSIIYRNKNNVFYQLLFTHLLVVLLGLFLSWQIMVKLPICRFCRMIFIMTGHAKKIKNTIVYRWFLIHRQTKKYLSECFYAKCYWVVLY